MAYSTINNQVSALVTFAKLHGDNIDIRGDYGTVLALKALRRVLGDTTTQKDAIFPQDLLSMSKFVSSENFLQISIWTGLVFLYRSMLRKCHIFVGEFNEHLLKRSDVEFTSFGLVVHVTSTKTIQYRERALDLPICRGGGKLCLVSLLEWYFDRYPTTPSSPILSRFEDKELITVPYAKALSHLKEWGEKANIGKDLGTHSMRRGAATLMSLGGMPLEDIKDKGDWKSDVFYQYISYPMQRKVGVEQKIVEMLNYLT